MSSWKILGGDTIEQLSSMLSASVDAIVTDPPYGIRIGGQSWDGTDIQEAAARAGGQRLDRPAAYGHWCRQWGSQCLRVLKPGAFMLAFGFPRTSHRMICGLEDAGLEVCDTLCWLFADRPPKSRRLPGGRGTTLKPGQEPIALLRRPFDGTTADTVNGHGTGSLELDACRVDGRYPANVVLTHDPDCSTDRCQTSCPTSILDTQTRGGRECPSRFYFRGRVSRRERDAGCDRLPKRGLASAHNPHPTVKPLDLMRWLVRLACPPGGLVLDPFCGSGSTGAAAILEDHEFVGIEQDHAFAEIAEARIRHWAADPGEETDPVPLGASR